jgi:hypothetical protein
VVEKKYFFYIHVRSIDLIGRLCIHSSLYSNHRVRKENKRKYFKYLHMVTKDNREQQVAKYIVNVHTHTHIGKFKNIFCNVAGIERYYGRPTSILL